MATNLTPEEIQTALEQYMYELNNFGKVTKETAESFKDAQTGVKNYTYNLNQSLKQLGTSIKSTTKDLKDGAQGASVFNNSLEASADVIANFASKFGILGTVIGTVIKAGTAYVSAANKQADALYKSYQDISRFGATGAGGMTELYGSMKKLGYGIEELSNMQALLKEQSQNLALFGGSALEGSRAMADMADQIQHGETMRGLMNLGISADQANRGLAGYLNLQTRLGYAQNKTQAELTNGAIAYMKEMEGLTRLTGMQREEMEAEMDRANAQEAFYAALQDMPEKQAKEALKMYVLLGQHSKEAAEEFGNQVSGFVGINDKTKLFMSTMGESADIAQKVKAGQLDAVGGITALGGALNKNRDMSKSLSQIGANNDQYLQLFEQDRLIRLTQNGRLQKSYDKVTDEVTKASMGYDEATDSMSGLIMGQRSARDGMQGFINLGVRPATSAMEALTEAVEDLVSILPGAKSRPGKGMNTAGYGQHGTGTRGGSVASMGAGAAAGAVAGSFIPLVGTGIGAAIGAAAGYFGYGAFGGGGKPSDFLKFGGESGSEANFNQLDSGLQDRLMAAGKQYKDITGNMLVITSAFRDPAKQQQLYNDWLARGKTGNPVAPPGSSLHEKGQAVDIQQGASGDRKAIEALNAAGLFQTVANDPVHFTAKNGGYRFGGIASGPDSGYQTTLHGTEAIVPLPNGKAIPVEMPGFSSSLSEQTGMMAQQIDKLDELINVMRNQLSVSQKILSYSH